MNKDERAKVIAALIGLADDAIEACKIDTLTKDGYGVMMRILEKMPEKSRELFLDLCVLRGYSKETAHTLKVIYGWE